jgi:uncharacterized protein YlxW (UPF0749 family)
MPDNPKRSILIKGNCTYCDKPVGVEVEEPAPIIQVKTEPCKCGLTENARTSRHWATTAAFVLVAVVVAGFGSCSYNSKNSVDLIRAETEKMKVQLIQEQERSGRLQEELTKYKTIIDELRKTAMPKEEKK